MGTLTFYITNKNIINQTTQADLIAQINTLFSNPVITIDPASNNVSIVTPYNIFTGKSVPLKILGTVTDRFLNTSDGTVYQKSSSEWAHIGQISYAAFITDAYFIVPNAISNTVANGLPASNNGNYLPLNSNPDPVVPVANDAILYLKENSLYLKTATNLFIVPLTNLSPSTMPVTPPAIINYNDYDTDKDFDMPITLNNQTNPSQSFPVTSTATINAAVTTLALYNQTTPALPGPFKTEVANISSELMYLAFSNGSALTLDEGSAYVMVPFEKRIFLVPVGYPNINVMLGGTTSTGEMRVTVEDLAASTQTT